jgi:TolA-binding protein
MVLGLWPALLAAQTPAPSPARVVDLADWVPEEREMLDQALGFLQAGDPSRALLLLEDLLRIHPQGRLVEEALYHAALAYRALGRLPEARQTLELRARRFPDGAWRLPSRLLEGELRATEGQWKEARPPLQEAAASPTPALARRAHYLLILAAEQLGDLPSARASIQALAADRKDNPHADFARLKQGVLAAREGKVGEADRAFQDVLAKAPDPALRAEAGVRAGALAQSRSQWPEAVANYEAARRTEAPAVWKQMAHLGLVQSHFAAGAYARAFEIYRAVRPEFPESARSQVLFLAAESARLAGKLAEAWEAYDFFLKEFPRDPQAEAAAWGRVLVRRAEAAGPETAPAQKALAAEAARFLAKHPQSTRRFQAGLIRAEALDTLGDTKASAPMLAALTADAEGMATLQPEARAALLLRAARAAYAAGTPGAARPLLARLLAEHPRVEFIADVLWLDGAAALASGARDGAFDSWDRLLREHPAHPQRESVLWQTALLAAGLERFSDMARLLQEYLKAYPSSSRAAEGHSLLGTALLRTGDGQASRPHWEIARTLAPAAYYTPATQQLIRLALLRQDTAGLRILVDEYDAWRVKTPRAPAVALEVYEWLGQQLADGTAPAEAERYLRLVLAASKDRPQRQRVQLRLAQLLSAQENHGAALREWTAYRVSFPEDANRSSVLEPLARAHLGAGQLEDAARLAEQILRQNPEGEFNARGRILLGDIALARRQPAEAAKIFAATALLIDDPRLTPRALLRAERAHRLAGQTREADAALLELNKRFPDFRE